MLSTSRTVTPELGPRGNPKVSTFENFAASFAEPSGPTFLQFLIAGVLSGLTGKVMTFCYA